MEEWVRTVVSCEACWFRSSDIIQPAVQTRKAGSWGTWPVQSGGVWLRVEPQLKFRASEVQAGLCSLPAGVPQQRSFHSLPLVSAFWSLLRKPSIMFSVIFAARTKISPEFRRNTRWQGTWDWRRLYKQGQVALTEVVILMNESYLLIHVSSFIKKYPRLKKMKGFSTLRKMEVKSEQKKKRCKLIWIHWTKQHNLILVLYKDVWIVKLSGVRSQDLEETQTMGQKRSIWPLCRVNESSLLC